MISSFKKEPYTFLSNFYPSVIMYDGEYYPTVEHAYQAAKTTNNAVRENIRMVKAPGRAKRIGNTIVIRAGWNVLKLEVMEYLLRQKFMDKDLQAKLLATGDEELVEGNWWGDTYWGICKGVGENHLGRLLMKIRSEV